ncbi:MAG: sensor domain-containing diguanylate cyclase [Candidatus Bipolaricaulota bacterium]|nr:sensor domain-containing diguanylate cyclase [Candidatus Bipolaricaulota bacterium]
MARTLSVLLVALAAVYLIVGLITLSGGDRRSTYVMGAAVVFQSVPWWLCRRGRLQASALILVTTVLAAVTVAATFGQGIHDIGVVAYPIVFVFAGLTLNRRLFALCVGLTLAAVTWLALGEAHGWFVTQPLFRDPTNLVYLTGLTILLLVGALAVHLLATNVRRSLGLARQELAEHKKTEEALTRAEAKLEKLHQASYELAGCRTEDGIYQLTVKAAEEILDFTLCTLDIIEGDRLVVKATSRELPPGASTESSLDEGLAGKTIRTGKSIVFGSLDEVPEAEPTREDFCSGISAPIGDLGVFQVVSTRPNAFTEEDARALGLLLAHTTATIRRVRLEGELKGQAIHDVLTGVYNRRFFNEVIEREMARSKRYAHPVAFVMIDVNRFKEINDRFGHLMGDRVLQGVADVLRQSVRDSDTVIRYGGDEFLVILPETNGNAGPAVERIRAAIAKRNVENPLLDFPVTLAIGVDHWHPDDPRSIESVLIEADRRMYEDKQLSHA